MGFMRTINGQIYLFISFSIMLSVGSYSSLLGFIERNKVCFFLTCRCLMEMYKHTHTYTYKHTHTHTHTHTHVHTYSFVNLLPLTPLSPPHPFLPPHQALDRDGDGRISVVEFARGFQSLYRSASIRSFSSEMELNHVGVGAGNHAASSGSSLTDLCAAHYGTKPGEF